MVGGEKFGCGTIKRTSLPPLTSSKSGPLKTRATSEQLAAKFHFNTISLGQSERFGEIESVGSDESQLDFAQRSDGLRTARTFQLNAILIGCSRTKKKQLKRIVQRVKNSAILPQKGSSSLVAKYMMPRPADLSA